MVNVVSILVQWHVEKLMMGFGIGVCVVKLWFYFGEVEECSGLASQPLCASVASYKTLLHRLLLRLSCLISAFYTLLLVTKSPQHAGTNHPMQHHYPFTHPELSHTVGPA